MHGLRRPATRMRSRVTRLAVAALVVVLPLLTAAKCPGNTPNPPDPATLPVKQNCIVGMYNKSALAHLSGQVVIYADITNWCHNPALIESIQIRLYFQELRGDDKWYRVSDIETVTLGTARIAATQSAGVIRATVPCVPNKTFRLRVDVVITPVDGKVITGGFNENHTGSKIHTCADAPPAPPFGTKA
jgi:hypothetical protein